MLSRTKITADRSRGWGVCGNKPDQIDTYTITRKLRGLGLPLNSPFLHILARHGLLTLCRLVLDVDNRKAAFVGEVDRMFRKIQQETDLAATDDQGYTALHWAARRGHTDVVSYLTEKGANLASLSDRGETALHLAAAEGCLIAVKLLVNKIDIELQDQAGQTALHLAAAHGHVEVLKVLIDLNADVGGMDGSGRTALHHCAAVGHLDAIEMLLDASAEDEASAQDEEGMTALHLATENGCLESMEMLMRKIDFSRQNNYGQTALHLATTVQTAKVLMDHIDNAIQDDQGQTALHIAARDSDWQVVKMLASDPTTMAVQDNDGKTALHLTVERHAMATAEGKRTTQGPNEHDSVEGIDTNESQALDAIKIMVNKGLDADIQDCEGKTALHLAAEYGDLKVGTLLLDRTDITIRDIDGRTALHWSALNGHVEVVRMLIEKGASEQTADLMEMTDDQLDTALDYALNQNHKEIVNLLLEYESMSQSWRSSLRK